MMKGINYILMCVVALSLGACTNLLEIDNESRDSSVTKADDLETMEIVMEMAGTLRSKLDDKLTTCQKLILSGPVDADDVTTIRLMQKLVYLDIANVSFVETEKTYETSSGTGGKHSVEIGKIGEHMFTDTSVATIILPNDITGVGKGAFFRSNIEEIRIPENVITLDDHCFQESKLKKIELPISLKTIGNRAFFHTQISFITIPESVNSIGDEAFSDTPITSISLPDGIKRIGYSTFASCKCLENVKLPNDLVAIDYNAFVNCVSLKSVDIPESVTSIERNAFAQTGLEFVKLPDNLQIISSGLFSSCVSLKEVQLPANLQKIEQIAFHSCESLKFMDIPASTKNIAKGAFSGTFRLCAIFINGKTTLEDLFGAPSNCLIYLSDPETDVSKDLNNIIVNGVAASLNFKDNGTSFFCPKEFKALKVSYTKSFNRGTQPETNYGWTSLSLPFTVTAITHEDGRVLAPFNTGVADAKSFWLRKLTVNGFENATSIEAGEPYIIAMPNNSRYSDEYNIRGTVTFSAQDVKSGIVIPATSYKKIEGPLFDINSSYEIQVKNASIYLLSDDGSKFVRSLRDSNPFEAYVTDKVISTKSPDVFSVGSIIRTRNVHIVGNKPSIDDM